MRWIRVLVTSNVPKHEKKRNQLAFLPNAQCIIETFSQVGLAFFIFLAFFLRFSRVSDTNMLV